MNIPVAPKTQARDEREAIPQICQTASASSLTIMIASGSDEVRQGLSDLLQGYHLDSLVVPSLQAAKTLLATRRIAVILCSFALEGGTYRDLLTEVKHKTLGIPVVVASTPVTSDEYRDYLASVNSGAFDFVCHPYQQKELDRILRLALAAYGRNGRPSPTVVSAWA